MRWVVLLDVHTELLWSSSSCLCLSTSTKSYLCFSRNVIFPKVPAILRPFPFQATTPLAFIQLPWWCIFFVCYICLCFWAQQIWFRVEMSLQTQPQTFKLSYLLWSLRILKLLFITCHNFVNMWKPQMTDQSNKSVPENVHFVSLQSLWQTHHLNQSPTRSRVIKPNL